ncbi:hypothetical protein WI93_11880 [Burkholderia vietnamiensis]|nr:hypothetical protein WI93_11880 [Burkholderia vietnamiensis]
MFIVAALVRLIFTRLPTCAFVSACAAVITADDASAACVLSTSTFEFTFENAERAVSPSEPAGAVPRLIF